MRKGYNSRASIPTNFLAKLNNGLDETITLSEWLAVDQGILLSKIFDEFNLGKPSEEITSLIRKRTKVGIMVIMKSIGKELWNLIETEGEWLYKSLKSHRSDIVREWSACAMMANEKLELKERLDYAKAYAIDNNINVREIAWYSIRPFVRKELKKAIEYFQSWVNDSHEGIRRCAIECTRPNGVWCTHIKEIQQNPDICLSLLSAVNSDESSYVRKSVGNWLNDESKHKSKWVIELCNIWLGNSKSQETEWIVNHGLRTLRKNGVV
ncbi:MAG: DNA alkylation repair enzyme [Candidatus Scalindua rubra]|uniref:DNA alkylation repair enzyme n=1 Tax=Candidatus Scalindua rubra TaxID=1872076 RepID=A0A1E3XBL6_9BACT|nr:MAG: DNA alkylation repair enzyme [Candidatus Scalindua rubra]